MKLIPKRKVVPKEFEAGGDVINYITNLTTQTGTPVNFENLLTAVVFIIDGGGAVITIGQKGYIRMPFVGTILNASLAADASGSIVIDIWKDTLANFPPTIADTITASAKPTLSSAQVGLDATLTGWTKAFVYGDFLAFNVDSCSTITRVTLTLVVKRS